MLQFNFFQYSHTVNYIHRFLLLQYRKISTAFLKEKNVKLKKLNQI